ncbi:tannase/feruloyl esterase family alpha/beta hydrolase [Enterovirga rhinocerotis]|uniref:Feruloyl esterase n=1 Tax=Enterovirga rhinocerotis TaxID=1339210 RepID=A0A4R7BV82_9HYPH|nr:tannase/feruloyl esterase family alpha/beta hydrolase [Enterovirga rhinocerotis]TDR89730.1 feruloyl esterase [Enterovirga rhinocerotis]
MRFIHLAGAAALLLLGTAASAQAQTCAALAGQKIDDVNLLSSTEVPAAGDLPGYCRVLGYVRPAINFEIRLPVQNWNGKFYMAGCGGFCGRLLSDSPGFTNAMNHGLRRNYAVATMDGGHWGASVVDGRWAENNLVARMDWGQRAVTETAKVGKAMVAAFYGKPQTKAYFAGCSTGGRMAAMEASRFPKDFDGIISGAPALDYTGLVATFFAWTAKANLGADGKPIITADKAKFIGREVYAACDEADGVKDGVIADPRKCDFKPAALQCKAGQNSECLTETEVGALTKIYQGPKDSRGRQLYPGGVPLGSEPHWARWITGAGAAPAILPLFGQDFIRYMAFDPAAGSAFKITDFDFDKDPARMGSMARVYNAATFDPDKPAEVQGADLSAFKAAGGKILFYHGWGDPLVTPFLTVDYYEALSRKAGGDAKDFARLFMVPGMDHCGIGQDGPGIADTGIDPLTALERWVEQGQAPDQIEMRKVAGGRTLWARPVCAYPQVAKYKGSGDAKDPANFACAAP